MKKNFDLFDRLLDISKGNLRQYIILTRHFFNRLFQNDIVDFEEQMKAKIIGLVALFAVMSAHVANLSLFKYAIVPDRGTSWGDKCLFMTFIMVLVGFITVLEWDILFLDARDFINLVPLPVKKTTILLSKFTSLILFVGMFAVGINSLSSLVFFNYLPGMHSNNLIYGLKFMMVHIVSSLASGFFMFFFLVFLIAMLMNILGPRVFEKIVFFLRSVLLIFFVLTGILLLNGSLSVFSQKLSSFIALKAQNDAFLYYYPPMWFTGLYECLLGNNDPMFDLLAKYAVLALLVPMGLFFPLTSLSYQRFGRVNVGERPPNGLRRLKDLFYFKIFNPIFLKNPIQRAVYYFFGSGLRRSMIHKMRLATFITISIGIGLFLFVIGLKSSEDIFQITRALLVIPLLIPLLLLVGLRGVINIPISIESNWIFQLTETKNKKDYFIGIRKAIYFQILFPIYTVFFLVFIILWGSKISLYHSAFGLFLSSFVMFVLFVDPNKIPFTCTYLPGKEKIHLLWLLYIILFIFYLTSFSGLEYKMLMNPKDFITFYLVLFLLYLALKVFQNFYLYKRIKILYEDNPDPVMIGLTNLDNS